MTYVSASNNVYAWTMSGSTHGPTAMFSHSLYPNMSLQSDLKVYFPCILGRWTSSDRVVTELTRRRDCQKYVDSVDRV